MNGGNNSRGYTIVEVLIFMAVSGLMFVFAAVFINGKQAQVEFRQGLYSVNSDIRTTINQVSNGRADTVSYTASRRCTVPGPNIPTSKPTFGAAVTARGASGGLNGCIFLGKVMHFNVTGQAEADTFYNVYTVAGRQMNRDGNPVTNFDEAQPVPMTPAYGAVDITDRNKIPGGLRITNALLCGNAACGGGTQVGQIGFFGSFNASQGTFATQGRLQSGAQTVITAVIPASLSNFGIQEPTAAQHIFDTADNINPAVHQLNNNRFILLCFRHGDKRGSISIGGINGQQFSTQVKTSNLALPCRV